MNHCDDIPWRTVLLKMVIAWELVGRSQRVAAKQTKQNWQTQH